MTLTEAKLGPATLDDVYRANALMDMEIDVNDQAMKEARK